MKCAPVLLLGHNDNLNDFLLSVAGQRGDGAARVPSPNFTAHAGAAGLKVLALPAWHMKQLS